MHFGRIETDLSNVDYSLPADSAMTISTLQGSQPSSGFQAYIGAPKWGYKNWIGTIFPKGTKDADFLGKYARHFNSIEFNATFYQIHSPERIFAWKQMVEEVPYFKFCPKFPQSISHIRRFRNVEEQTNEFYTSISVLGTHLGPLFLQLPDNFSSKFLSELKTYLITLPAEVPVFVEVRHKNWFIDNGERDNLFNCLRELNMGTVISDTAGRRDCLHMTLPIPHAFIRFVDSGDEPTDLLRLEGWIKRLKEWKQQGLQSLYFFIHAGDAPSLSLYDYFITKLNQELQLNIQLPGETPH
ncbi:DUF72 domain-containing protein [Mucilaginibacter sp. cycad4]|uniref:DUF72 domain-containing protein n=1 Tax=Mucilaginibacter sp. cycad4 TaxID=3342096 RepID=UPI002AAA87BE|nr:DUF72 domain-containing protein [Mucilaginibacter gossypii]WPU99194.1 DUF72 domain-containing protein [Mucilaginibacter gossypii]